MKSVAPLGRQGGTGKTTPAIHRGVPAEVIGRKVLFCDPDPRRGPTAWWKSRAAATPVLIEADVRRLAQRREAADGEGYDLAVINTPPAVTFDTAGVAGIVDRAPMPLRPGILDVDAVESTVAVVKAARTDTWLVLNACLPPQGMGEATMTIEARKAREGMSLSVAEVSLARRRDGTRALNDGEAVNGCAPDSKAAKEMTRLWREVERRLV